ncbi:hypothetical protein PVV74_03770 [Roseovarius sp. SK2]|uniref:tetratricopeptide repeat protein n=1 Tax=Roseovarius TaxID=74030 RepID=UPI00237BF414|nr:hypothetical protein [Roseovarius sp. SK2]MDD9724567.1 hypothetical protein [Roseovarius sp. SK2]
MRLLVWIIFVSLTIVSTEAGADEAALADMARGAEKEEAGDPRGAALHYWQACIALDEACRRFFNLAQAENLSFHSAVAAIEAICIRGDSEACAFVDNAKANMPPLPDELEDFVGAFLDSVRRYHELTQQLLQSEQDIATTEGDISDVEKDLAQIEAERERSKAALTAAEDKRRNLVDELAVLGAELKRDEAVVMAFEVILPILEAGDEALRLDKKQDYGAIRNIAEEACPLERMDEIVTSIDVIDASEEVGNNLLLSKDVRVGCLIVAYAFEKGANYETALAYYRQACAMESTSACVYGLGLVAGKDAAAPDFSAAIDLAGLAMKNPTSDFFEEETARAAELLGSVALQLDANGRHEKALDLANFGLSLDPDSSEPRYVRGQIRLRALDDPRGAISDFSALISRETGSVGAFFLRGVAHQEIGFEKGAYLDYTRALNMAPDFTAAREKRARLAIDMERYQESERDYTHLIDDLESKSEVDIALASSKNTANSLSVYYWNRALLRERLGNVRGAREDKRQSEHWSKLAD